MKPVNPFILPMLALGLSACGGGSDSGPGSSGMLDPSDDKIWTSQSDGIGGAELFNRIPDGTYTWEDSGNGITASCTAIDADGDGDQDDGSLQQLDFASDNTSMQARLAIFLDNPTCALVSYRDFDYADQIEASYTVSSSSFDFNRIDLTVTNIAREVKSTAAVSALNTATGACGKTDWAQLTYSHSTGEISCDGDSNTMNGIHNPFALSLPGSGDELDGVYISSGGLFTAAFGSAGSRPDEDDIASMTSDGLSGGPMFSR